MEKRNIRMGITFILGISLMLLVCNRQAISSETAVSLAKMRPKMTKYNSGSVVIGRNSKIIVADTLDGDIANESIQRFAKRLAELPPEENAVSIAVRQVVNPLAEAGVQDRKRANQGFHLQITEAGILIEVADSRGLLYALNYITSLVDKSRKISSMDVYDWPSHLQRGIHIPLGTGSRDNPAIPTTTVKSLLSFAQQNNFNFVIFQLANRVAFVSSPVLRPPTWSIVEFQEVVSFARHLGFDVVLEVKLLTHQEKFLGAKFPALMFNKLTYDPRITKVYDLALPYLKEIVTTIKPMAILIGHDEVAGLNEWTKKHWLNSGEEMLPAELFLQDVLRIHNYLKELDVETWMWGDMLISEKDVPTMHAKHWGGGAPGYGKAVRGKIPKDMVICDWHYFDDQTDFPSIDMFKREGLRVLGATWKKSDTIRNFSRYAFEHGADGMIATTWSFATQEEWNTVGKIIAESGTYYFNPGTN